MPVIRFCTKKMRAIAAHAVAGALSALLALTMGVRVSAEPRVALTIRLYNASAVPSQELLAARRAVESTFRDTGVDLIVRLCGRPTSSADPVGPCNENLRPLEIVVRVIDAPAFSSTLHAETCGMAYLVRDTDRGWLATVFSDRIDGAAARVGADSGTLLGLVIAHEVGHLLLGAGYHGWSGVMQADWPDALLSRTGEPWHFSQIEAARMREAARF
jgi:hypothetical protein